MKEMQYRAFSLKTHKKNWRAGNPNICQFELTFQCGLRCRHCYTSCYNNSEYIKEELAFKDIKLMLDKLYSSGVIWLCLTGGDPLARPDFLDIYSYARKKGFIVMLFTSGYSMTGHIAGSLKKTPPFVIEMTLNSVTKEGYEKISQVAGSFEKTMSGLRMIIENELPVKIKTQVTKDNLKELPEIKEFVEGLGLKFTPSSLLHARLDGDTAPCSLRVELKGASRLVKKEGPDALNSGCNHSDTQANRNGNSSIFNCAIGGGDGLYVDPSGDLIPCDCIREPRISLLREDVLAAQKKILEWVRARRFETDSKCRHCAVRDICRSCPGKALLEKGSLEEPLEWFCKWARSAANSKRRIKTIRQEA